MSNISLKKKEIIVSNKLIARKETDFFLKSFEYHLEANFLSLLKYDQLRVAKARNLDGSSVDKLVEVITDLQDLTEKSEEIIQMILRELKLIIREIESQLYNHEFVEKKEEAENEFLLSSKIKSFFSHKIPSTLNNIKLKFKKSFFVLFPGLRRKKDITGLQLKMLVFFHTHEDTFLNLLVLRKKEASLISRVVSNLGDINSFLGKKRLEKVSRLMMEEKVYIEALFKYTTYNQEKIAALNELLNNYRRNNLILKATFGAAATPIPIPGATIIGLKLAEVLHKGVNYFNSTYRRFSGLRGY